MLLRLLILAQAALLLGATGLCARADDAASMQIAAPRPFLSVPFTSMRPATTADPVDPAWNGVSGIPSLELAIGSSGSDKVFATSVKALWDVDFLYLRFQVDDDLIPYAPAYGHDADLTGDDLIVLQIDPQGAAHHWFQVEASAENDIRDESFVLNGPVKSDNQFVLLPDLVSHTLHPNLAWNIDGLQTATRLTRYGWLADFAIPATPLLAPTGARQLTSATTFRANFLRYQYVSPLSPSDLPRRIVMNWAPVAAGKQEVSPEGMGFLQLTGGPTATGKN